MGFKVVITRTDTVTRKEGKTWAKVGQGPVKIDEDQFRDGQMRDAYAGKIVDVFGYTPEIEKEVEVETQILTQEVEELNLVNVIKAINGIS